jgi:predicted regulator of Ras-like GTPase activity (Roadblock/LC7/MglB family)
VYRLELSSGELEFATVEGVDGKIVILDNNRVMLARPNTSYIVTSFF